MAALTTTLLASASVLLLTTVHHVYGAIIYATPWRHHVVFIAIPVLIGLMMLYRIYRTQPRTAPGRVSLWLFMMLVLVVPVATIGLIEGGYNHAVKNLLYFGGASPATLAQLFPPPQYELPNDFWFELTGVFQFPLGLAAAYYLFRTWQERAMDQLAPGT